ncbi:MAG: 50S ribosomal protein L10 [Parcubacteria group bacterium]
MAKSKSTKQQFLTDLSGKLKSAKSAVIADYTGLKVSASEELRRNCGKENVEFLATKKTLLKIALKEQGIDIETKDLAGSLGLAISAIDEAAPAKIIKNFAKKHPAVAFRAGILDGKLISMETLKQLADLPSKIELLAKTVATIKAPITGFVNVLAGNLRGLINVLNAVKNNK